LASLFVIFLELNATELLEETCLVHEFGQVAGGLRVQKIIRFVFPSARVGRPAFLPALRPLSDASVSLTLL
jgi:hypothetical protein